MHKNKTKQNPRNFAALSGRTSSLVKKKKTPPSQNTSYKTG